MKNKSMLYLSAFVTFIMLTSLACSALSSAPTAIPIPPTRPPVATNPPATQAPQSNNSGNTNNGGNTSGGLVTFTDQNNFYEIQVPSDWKHTSGTGDYSYWDRFTSPDQHAFIENVAYDDGTPWTGSQNGAAALKLLNSYYSYTKKEGDIHVTDDSIQPDNSERLVWYSAKGNYSGDSFFEVRGSNDTTFLMFTIAWDDDYEQTYFDLLNNVVASYTTP